MENSSQRYVAHLDILGMRALTARDHRKAWHMLSALEIALTRSTRITIVSESFSDPIHVPELVKSIAFSDTIILYTDSDSPRDFHAIFTAALNLFSKALHLRVPVRIGISKGVFYTDEQRSMYAGPALIEAYDIGEASQWLGIVLSEPVAKDAIAQDSRKGATNMVVDWNVPTKKGPRRASVANWPIALEDSFKIDPPFTPQQLYSIFEEYYGPFTKLPESDTNKYINTVDFINVQYALHKQKQSNGGNFMNSDSAVTPAQVESSKSSLVWRIARELFAASVWGWLLIKVFRPDFDLAMVRRYAPRLEILIKYPLLTLLVGIASLWLVLGNSRCWRLMAWTAAYPFILWWRAAVQLILLAAPRWPIVIGFLPAIYEYVLQFKQIFISYAFLVLSIVMLRASSQPFVLGAVICYMMVFLLLHYTNAFRRAYRVNAFRGLAEAVKRVRCKIEEGAWDKLARSSGVARDPLSGRVGDITGDKQKIYHSSLRIYYFSNFGFEWIADKFRDSMRGRKPELCLFFSWFYSLLLSMCIFGFAFYGLFKIQEKSFSNVGNYPFWQMLGLSVSRITMSGISPVTAQSGWAYVLSYAEIFAQIFIYFVLPFLFFTTQRESYREDIDAFVLELKNSAKAGEMRVRELFELTFESVEFVLLASDGPLINLSRKLRGLPELALGENKDSTENSPAGEKDNGDRGSSDVDSKGTMAP